MGRNKEEYCIIGNMFARLQCLLSVIYCFFAFFFSWSLSLNISVNRSSRQFRRSSILSKGIRFSISFCIICKVSPSRAIGPPDSICCCKILSPYRWQKSSIPKQFGFSIKWPASWQTNKVTVRLAKTQIRLGIRPVWSESSLALNG